MGLQRRRVEGVLPGPIAGGGMGGGDVRPSALGEARRRDVFAGGEAPSGECSAAGAGRRRAALSEVCALQLLAASGIERPAGTAAAAACRGARTAMRSQVLPERRRGDLDAVGRGRLGQR